jgi:MSHA pilin protein MshC
MLMTTSIQQKGFTLVELIVVIVILGIISAVAAPRFFDQQAYKERVFKDDLVSALRYAQKRAVASGQAVQVVIDASGFTLSYVDGTVVLHPDGDDFKNIDPPPLTLTANTIIFDALGRATATVGLDDVGFANSDITIYEETGCVTQ